MIGKNFIASIPREYWSILGLILSVKLGIFLLGIIAFAMVGDALPGQTLAEITPKMWEHWDSHWYLQIAEHGYQTEGDSRNGIAFFPLYPLLVRLVAVLFIGNYFWSAWLIANLASLAGLALFYFLARLEFGKEAARWSLVAILLFPTAYFFNAPYTEGLFFLLAVSSFYAARRGKWLLAGVLGGLAAFTRMTGVLLAPALMVEFYLQWKEKGGRIKLEQILPLFIVPAVFGIYLLFNKYLLENPLGFQEVLRDRWYKTFSWPWQGLGSRWRDIGGFPWQEYNVLYGMGEFGAGVLLVAATIWAYYKVRLSYFVYMALAVFMVLSTSWLMSTPRYALTVFPLFFVIGQFSRYRGGLVVWLMGSVMLLTLLTLRYVHGWWAF